MKKHSSVARAAVALIMVASAAAVSDAMAADARRSYATGRFVVELEGTKVGAVTDLSGGGASGDVVVEPGTRDGYRTKHVGQVRYEDIGFSVTPAMGNPMLDWMRATIAAPLAPSRKSGAILTTDYDGKEMSRLAFTNAFISDVVFPGCDAAGREPSKILVTLTPDRTSRVAGGGGSLKTAVGKEAGGSKAWTPANFRFNMDGIDAETNRRVSKIEPIGVRFKSSSSDIGDRRDYEKTATTVDISNLVIYVPEANAKPFFDWFDDFVIRGNNSDAKERNATLDYMSPNLQESFFTLNLRNVGIVRITPATADAGADTIRRVKVEMYVETIRFDHK